MAVVVEWRLFDQYGALIDGEQCQVLVSVEGPATVPSERSARCANKNAQHLNVKLPEAGEYTISVLDELSGVEGSTAVTVLPHS
ncbi:hypothetical protein [Salana multivorans]